MPKVLCLHGWGTSGEFMKLQMKYFSKLFPEFEFHYLSGPFELPDSLVRQDPIVQKISPDKKYYAWKINLWDEIVPEGTLDFSAGVNSIVEHLNKHGPYDGILGFSMGGLVAQLFFEAHQEGKLSEKLKVACPKFLMLCSSSHFRTNQELINVPSIHIVGEADFIRDLCATSTTKYLNPLVIRHCKGHQFPKLNDMEIDAIRKYLQPILGQYKPRLPNPRL